MDSDAWADQAARSKRNLAHAQLRFAGRLRESLARSPKNEAEPEPGPIDMRGGWAMAGAWAAALGGVRLDAAGQAAWAIGLWLAAGVALLALLRPRHGRIGSAATPSFAAPALCCAAAALIFTQLLLAGAGTNPRALHAAAATGEPVRVQLEFTATPRAGTAVNRFSEDPREHTQYTVEARVLRMAEHGSWLGAGVPVHLSYPASRAPAAPLPAGSTLEVLARVSAAEPGAREPFWLNAASDLLLVGAVREPGVFERLRSRFVQACAVLPEPGRALLPGMVFGDRSGADEELNDAMKVAGLSHLTAVSGANCAIVMGFVAGACRLAGARRAPTLLLGLLALSGFVLLVGYEPSVLRAAVMGSIAAVGVHSSRGRKAMAALMLAVVLLLAYDPWLAGEPAFQLSALATAGIVLIGRPLAVRLNRWMPALLAEGIAIALAAQIACLPVLVVLNPSFSLYSVPANLVVAPFIPWITVAGTLGVPVLAVFEPAGSALVWLAGMPATTVGLLGTWIAALPGALRPWPAGAAGVLLAWGILVGTLVGIGQVDPAAGNWKSRARLAAQGVVTGVLLGLLLPVTALVPTPAVGDWLVVSCDVGQGDGMLVNAGEAGALVIDTGREPEQIDECLRRMQVEHVAAVFITHQHADHDGGLEGVGPRRSVDALYYSMADSTQAPPAIEAASGEDPRAEQLESGATGGAGTVSWKVLGPLPGGVFTDENDASLVIRFEIQVPGPARPISLLATGDMQEEAMDQLIGKGLVGPADILKVAHHGAANGGTRTAPVVHPSLALISVGAGNTYGHPSETALRALEENQVTVLRTDQRGTIVVGWNGQGLQVTSWGPDPPP